ncbi:MAG: UDP-N-acetylmuramate dehydrogenase [bacterium]
MKIFNNYNLAKLNTLRIQAKAKFFVEIEKESELQELFLMPEFKNNKKFFLGSGSNILFTGDFGGVVVKVSMLGKKVIEENSESVLLEVAAGEVWHDLVTYAVSNNFGGVENLAFVPGTVGAAPVQNIAAYGESFSDVFISLDAFNVETGKIEKFNKEECKFGYRESVFKKEFKNKYIILKVRLQLLKNPQIEDSYYQIGITRDSVKEEMNKIAIPPFYIKDVYQAVINIRSRKLPDPLKIPNAGSSFLNSVVSRKKYEELKEEDSELQSYPVGGLSYKTINDGEDFVKVATGRLLQNLGWLGKWIGNVGVHDKHALIIVTNGKATGEEVVNFIEMIKKSYFDKYGIKLETEVNLI